ncbi:unnamed protein product [Ectocarpus sp. CCAP 1310/34]|nr:unnamed protein product [Ectocarpus sp. CCAP 1310/34]
MCNHFTATPDSCAMEVDKDAVSAVQESVDQLALSMFDSLRLIPFSEEVKGGARGVAPLQQQQQQPGQPGAAPLRRAVTTNAAWADTVQSLADGVLKQARALDGLIDVLPGAELREDQQMEEIARLDREGKLKRAELAKMVEKAEALSKEVNGSLDQLADHMLGAPR